MSSKTVWTLSDSENENDQLVSLVSDLPEHSSKFNNQVDQQSSLVCDQFISCNSTNVNENLQTYNSELLNLHNKNFDDTNNKLLNSNVVCISSDSEESLQPHIESILHVSNTFYEDSDIGSSSDINSTTVDILKSRDLLEYDDLGIQEIKQAECNNKKSILNISLTNKTVDITDISIPDSNNKESDLSQQNINQNTTKKLLQKCNSKIGTNKSDIPLDCRKNNLENSSISFSNHGIYLDDFNNFENPCITLNNSLDFQINEGRFVTENIQNVESQTLQNSTNANKEKHYSDEVICIDLTEEDLHDSKTTKQNQHNSFVNNSNAFEFEQNSIISEKESFALSALDNNDSSIKSYVKDDSLDSLEEEFKRSVFSTYRMRTNKLNTPAEKYTKTNESKFKNIKNKLKIDLDSRDNLKRKTTPFFNSPSKKKLKISLPEHNNKDQAKSKDIVMDIIKKDESYKTKELKDTSLPKLSENDQNTEFIKKERLKALKPENCLQHVTCQIDESIVEKVKLSMETLSKIYDNCNFEKVNIMHPCVCWIRTIPNGLLEEPDIEICKHMYLFYTASELAELLLKTDNGRQHCLLKNFLIKKKQQNQTKRKFHVMCFGYEKFKTKVRRKELPSKSSKLKEKAAVITVSNLEKAMIAFEFKMKIDFIFIEELKDLMVLLQQLTKSIAEEPYKNATRKAVICTSSGSSVKVS